LKNAAAANALFAQVHGNAGPIVPVNTNQVAVVTVPTQQTKKLLYQDDTNNVRTIVFVGIILCFLHAFIAWVSSDYLVPTPAVGFSTSYLVQYHSDLEYKQFVSSNVAEDSECADTTKELQKELNRIRTSGWNIPFRMQYARDTYKRRKNSDKCREENMRMHKVLDKFSDNLNNFVQQLLFTPNGLGMLIILLTAHVSLHCGKEKQIFMLLGFIALFGCMLVLSCMGVPVSTLLWCRKNAAQCAVGVWSNFSGVYKKLSLFMMILYSLIWAAEFINLIPKDSSQQKQTVDFPGIMEILGLLMTDLMGWEKILSLSKNIHVFTRLSDSIRSILDVTSSGWIIVWWTARYMLADVLANIMKSDNVFSSNVDLTIWVFRFIACLFSSWIPYYIRDVYKRKRFCWNQWEDYVFVTTLVLILYCFSNAMHRIENILFGAYRIGIIFNHIE